MHLVVGEAFHGALTEERREAERDEDKHTYEVDGAHYQPQCFRDLLPLQSLGAKEEVMSQHSERNADPCAHLFCARCGLLAEINAE